MRPAALATLLVAAALTGCGDRGNIEHGGQVPGTILTVYALVPREGPHAAAADDLVRGAKLALSAAGGKVGKFTIQFATENEPEDNPKGVATAVENLVRDTGTIAVISDLDTRTARISAPLLNAIGMLQLSPVGTTTFLQPSAESTFRALGADPAAQAAAIQRLAKGPYAVESEAGRELPLSPTVPTEKARTVIYDGSDAVNARGAIEGILQENKKAQVIVTGELASTDVAARLGPRVKALTTIPAAPPPGYDTAFPGATPGLYSTFGYDAMNAVLTALRSAGKNAQSRQAVIRAFQSPPVSAARLVD